jgi:hypothetical protein
LNKLAIIPHSTSSANCQKEEAHNQREFQNKRFIENSLIKIPSKIFFHFQKIRDEKIMFQTTQHKISVEWKTR